MVVSVPCACSDVDSARHAFDYGAARQVDPLSRQCILTVPCDTAEERLESVAPIRTCLANGLPRLPDVPDDSEDAEACVTDCIETLERCGGDCSWSAVEGCLSEHSACLEQC